MARCQAIKRDGERCRGEAMPGAEWCYSHHPDYAEARRRNARRGGKSGGRGRPGHSPELASIKVLLEDLTEKVLEYRVGTGAATVANQLINTRLRAIEQERKIKETEDLEARIEALEEQQEDQKGDGKGGRTRATS